MSLKKPENSPPHLYEMAQRLKLERRLHPRVKVPLQSWPDFSGPVVEWNQHRLPLHDMSEGGLCLDDVSDVLGAKIGQDIVLQVHFADQQSFEIPSRLVGTNISKRHIQFQEARSDFRNALRTWVQFGLRGQWIKQLQPTDRPSNLPILWTSLYNDSLSMSDDPRWHYLFGLEGEVYLLSVDFWPVQFIDLKPISVQTFDKILMALENLTFADEDADVIRHSLHLIRRRSFE